MGASKVNGKARWRSLSLEGREGAQQRPGDQGQGLAASKTHGVSWLKTGRLNLMMWLAKVVDQVAT